MKTKHLLIGVAMLLASLATKAQTAWTVDKGHSVIGFNVTHMVVAEVPGSFKEYEATVSSPKADDFNGADIQFTAKVGSIFTDNERRDGHLKSGDFFDAEKFPDLTFKGKLTKKGSKYKLTGNLTIKDVTKPVTFDVTYGGMVDTGKGVKAGFKILGTINRLDYGLKWDSKMASGELVVADEVEISCKIELNKAAQ